MLATVTGIAVLIVWWMLALLVAFFRIKPNDKRYPAKPGTTIRGTLANVSLGTLFALWTYNEGDE